METDRPDVSECAQNADSVNLGDRDHGGVAEFVGLGSSGVATLAWREGCRFYEAAFRDFAQRIR
jgi:hypothetical protein